MWSVTTLFVGGAFGDLHMSIWNGSWWVHVDCPWLPASSSKFHFDIWTVYLKIGLKSSSFCKFFLFHAGWYPDSSTSTSSTSGCAACWTSEVFIRSSGLLFERKPSWNGEGSWNEIRKNIGKYQGSIETMLHPLHPHPPLVFLFLFMKVGWIVMVSFIQPMEYVIKHVNLSFPSKYVIL